MEARIRTFFQNLAAEHLDVEDSDSVWVYFSNRKASLRIRGENDPAPDSVFVCAFVEAEVVVSARSLAILDWTDFLSAALKNLETRDEAGNLLFRIIPIFETSINPQQGFEIENCAIPVQYCVPGEFEPENITILEDTE